MLDIKQIRSYPEMFKTAMKNRNKDIDVDAILRADDLRRELISATDAMKSEQNTDSKKIPQYKKEGKNDEANKLLTYMKELSENIKENDVKLRAAEESLLNILLSLPNIPHDSVPVGKDSDDNVEVRRFGTPS